MAYHDQSHGRTAGPGSGCSGGWSRSPGRPSGGWRLTRQESTRAWSHGSFQVRVSTESESRAVGEPSQTLTGRVHTESSNDSSANHESAPGTADPVDSKRSEIFQLRENRTTSESDSVPAAGEAKMQVPAAGEAKMEVPAAGEAKMAEDEILPMDSKCLHGKLKNGLTYYVQTNKKPLARCELRLVVKVGSVFETDEVNFFNHFCARTVKNFSLFSIHPHDTNL